MKITTKNNVDGGTVCYYTEVADFLNEITPAALQAVGTWMDPLARTYWHGGCNLWESIELAKTGALADPAAIELSDRISTKIRPAQETVCFMDVTGGSQFDVGKLVAGVPECVFNYREEQSRSRKTIAIVVEMAQSCSTDCSLFTIRGAAIMALVDALERSGRYKVSVYCTISGGTKYTGSGYQPTIRLKEPGHHYDPSVLSFWLCSPAVFRQVGFAHYDLCPEREALGRYRGWHGADNGLNLPGLMSAIDEREEVINLTKKMHSSFDSFKNYDLALAWVESQLEIYQDKS